MLTCAGLGTVDLSSGRRCSIRALSGDPTLSGESEDLYLKAVTALTIWEDMDATARALMLKFHFKGEAFTNQSWQPQAQISTTENIIPCEIVTPHQT